MNPSRRWQRNETHHIASSLAEKSNPDIKAKQTPANQTQSCLSKKKKKKKIPQYTKTKTKP